MNPKNEIRQKLKKELLTLSHEEKKRQSLLLCGRLINHPALQNIKNLGVYLPLPDEPDLRPALANFLQKGIHLYLPFPETEGTWSFHQILHLQSGSTGLWNLDLPDRGETIHPEELGIILVPGRGFTPGGDRIGRGKGIYDQLLQHTSAIKIGIGFNCQLVEKLPSEPHDIQLDEIWTADSMHCEKGS